MTRSAKKDKLALQRLICPHDEEPCEAAGAFAFKIKTMYMQRLVKLPEDAKERQYIDDLLDYIRALFGKSMLHGI